MIRGRNITVGKYYINNRRRIAREVLKVYDNTIMFITHHLDTGNTCGLPSICMKKDLINWADREATPAELASLQYRRAEALLLTPQFSNQDELTPI